MIAKSLAHSRYSLNNGLCYDIVSTPQKSGATDSAYRVVPPGGSQGKKAQQRVSTEPIEREPREGILGPLSSGNKLHIAHYSLHFSGNRERDEGLPTDMAYRHSGD